MHTIPTQDEFISYVVLVAYSEKEIVLFRNAIPTSTVGVWV